MNILITGTNSGIGKALKESLGVNHNIFKVSKNQSDEDNFFQCDLTQNENIEKLDFSDTIFDMIIFNAGVGYYSGFFEQNLEHYEEIINLNLLSPIRLLKKLEHNIDKKTKIIFMGSIASKKFMKNGSVYLASKFGLRGFAGGLKEEGKKVYIINPKIVETDFHKGKIDLPENINVKSPLEIVKLVEDIISGKETRFEIDL
ncbi:MAG: SDR family NAD(P)-dependent oxidoreductase [Candidatus Gracilibacteria bacterium]|nr:SDR family NAD(P)-dependent oxidoreductase [Candidatus Gracilibacteria bacterium]